MYPLSPVEEQLMALATEKRERLHAEGSAAWTSAVNAIAKAAGVPPATAVNVKVLDGHLYLDWEAPQ